jgi:hypothetical protein
MVCERVGSIVGREGECVHEEIGEGNRETPTRAPVRLMP